MAFNNLSRKIMNVIKERRSVRTFTGEKVPEKDIRSIIEASIWAPTGCNNQELRFLVLDTEEEIEEFLDFKPFFKDISTVVLLFADMSLPMSKEMYYKRKYEAHLPYIDTGLALSNMILYAKSIGIDSCVFNISKCHFKRRNVRTDIIRRVIHKVRTKLGLYASMQDSFDFYLKDKLRVPRHLKVLCGVAFGFAKEYPDVKKDTHGGKKLEREEVDFYILDRDSF